MQQYLLTILILLLAHSIYGMPYPTQLLSLILFIAIGVLAFRAMGGIIGAVANSMQEAQIIMATHSPILLSYPGADVLAIEDGQFRRIDYRESEHFRISTDFLKDPERFFRHLFKD